MFAEIQDAELRTVSGCPEFIRCCSSRFPNLAVMETAPGLDPSDTASPYVVDAVCSGPDSQWTLVHMGYRRIRTIPDRARSDALVGRIQPRSMV